jgi:hypothetical protein
LKKESSFYNKLLKIYRMRIVWCYHDNLFYIVCMRNFNYWK